MPTMKRKLQNSTGTLGTVDQAAASICSGLAAELGWIVAEYGRQPWAIDGLLPTFLGVSATPRTNVLLSLTGFTIFYSALAAVDVFLLLRMIRRGPDGLGYWPTPPTVAVSH